MSQQVTLSKVLKAANEQSLKDVYTSMPGVIVTVREDGKQQYLDVLPALNIVDEQGRVVEHATVLNVPLQQFASMMGGVLVPVRVGDPCWLHFSMRGLDVWKRGNGRTSTPTDDRRFNLNDCYATVGVVPMQMSLQDQAKRSWTHDVNDVVLYHNMGTPEETEIRLHVSGGVTVNTNQEVTLNANNVTVNSEETVINSTSATVNIQQTDWTGNTTQVGNITLNGNLMVSGSISGASVSAASISANGVEMAAHVHAYTWTDGPGSGVTSPA